jgi:hypothetical protein
VRQRTEGTTDPPTGLDEATRHCQRGKRIPLDPGRTAVQDLPSVGCRNRLNVPLPHQGDCAPFSATRVGESSSSNAQL